MKRADPVRLEIFKNLFHATAEEMGAALRRTAFSPNIKERRDYSCAVFDGAGEVVAMGDHMPVHLGSMPMSVQAAIEALDLEDGDIAMLNDPFAGGTHLPDITLVMPVYAARGREPLFYVASRAHHADVGGAQPGSMGLARDIYQEGVRIPPVKIAVRGRMRRDVLGLILANVRTPVEREGDLTAQVAACRLGARRLAELVERYGAAEVRAYMVHLLDYSERMMRATLRRIPAGRGSARRRRHFGRPGSNSRAHHGAWWAGASGLHRFGAADSGERQRGAGDYGLGGVLRLPLPCAGRDAGDGGAAASD
jgi:N-methylhydantoinase B